MTHTRIVMLRHGRTEWNGAGRLQGQADIALDAVGLAQAGEAARYFRDWHFDACYSSDLRRAMVTAETVAGGHDLEVVAESRLREINVGSWSGKTTAEVSQELPDFIDLYTRGVDFRRSATGETLAEMTDRVVPMVLEAAARHPGGQVLLVTHGLLISTVVQALVGIPPAVVLAIPGNVCYSVLGIAEDRRWLITHNAPTAAGGTGLPPAM
ncbi:histidine phosphatase family protein [Arachnia propionica]|uniref:Histidine phosphatase family protein n=1 Tax=Arachnia propionica TaxID=1750 RepID=A0A3P1T6Q6_9ACTN|nr:histidine phosphatase family protein [Arachnia propionica]MDO5084542.1 histidine phosphatase family protein [Arachnia propionica]RRD05010.1 histidine phosphatase family protein [Arachnia propionica]